MQEVGWPALLPGWVLRMQLAVLWGTWRGQHIPPGCTDVPEGDRNGSLLQELGILMGNLVVLLLSLYRVNSAGPCFMFSYTNLCKSLNCQNTNVVGKNPCEIVESCFSKDLSSSYSTTAASSIMFPVTPSHTCLHSFSAVPELPPTLLYHLLCKQQPVLWLSLNYTYTSWSAGRPNRRGREKFSAGGSVF